MPGRAPVPLRVGPLRAGPILPAFLLALAACSQAPSPEVEGAPVQAVPPEVQGEAVETDPAAVGPAPNEAASPASSAPASAEPAQQPPLPATIDSFAARLLAIGDAQTIILDRLDSLQSAVSSASGEADRESADSADGLQLPDLEEATDDVQDIGIGIALSLLVILLFHFLIRAVAWVLDTLAERNAARRLSFKWLVPITRMLLWAVAAFLIVNNIFQVDAQGIIAAGAALGVGIAVAAQDVLKNVLGGLTVVFDKPFQVGDKILVGGTYGEVVSIGLRSTRILTADDDLVSLPNSQVVQEQVSNSNSGQLNCMVVANLHLPGRVDERRAREIAFEAVVTSKYVFLKKPISVLVVDDFRTTFVTRLRVRAYVLDPRYEVQFQSDMTERARAGFRAAGLMPERDWLPWGVPAAEGDAAEGAL